MRSRDTHAAAGRMLVLVALGELLGMTVWFSATAAAPSIAREFSLDASSRAWLTMAVQAGFVAGTLITAVTNVADVINPRRFFAGALIAAGGNAGSRSCRAQRPSSPSASAPVWRSRGCIRQA